MADATIGTDVSIGTTGGSTPGTAGATNAPFSGNSDDRGAAPGRNPGSNPDNPGDDPGVREPLAKPDVVANDAPGEPAIPPTESASSPHQAKGNRT